VRSWVLTDSAEERMRLEDRLEPEVGPTQVLVDLRAASLNYRDLIFRDQPPRPGLVPVSDGAGEVVAVGADVRGVRAGERVVGGFFADWASGPPRHANQLSALGGDLDGVLSERVLFEGGAVAKIPEALSYTEASTFPCAAVTAWHALVGHAFPLCSEDVVLTLGTGGVSMFAFQLARLRGARVVATSSSEAKRERLRELGADVVLDYSREDLDEAAREATDGRGVDFIVETGGAATLERSLRACAIGGCVTLVGVLSGRASSVDAGLVHERELTLRSVYAGPLSMLREVLVAFVEGGVRPILDRSFAFDDAPVAFDHQRAARHFGKVVIER
jgi:NADPH:quinone reductase-like Zn-dependent oxidoreductase